MNNWKKVALAFLIAFCSVASSSAKAVFEAAILQLKNGEKIECQVDRATYFAGKLVYRLSPSSKPIKVKQEEVLSIVIPDEKGNYSVIENVMYVKANDFLKGDASKTSYKMMSLVEYGPMCLYCYSVNTYQNGAWTGTQSQYICRKNGSDYGVLVGRVFVNPKFMSSKTKTQTMGDFKKLYEPLFCDYPELCQQIRDEKLKFENIEDIVHEYNLHFIDDAKNKDKK